MSQSGWTRWGGSLDGSDGLWPGLLASEQRLDLDKDDFEPLLGASEAMSVSVSNRASAKASKWMHS